MKICPLSGHLRAKDMATWILAHSTERRARLHQIFSICASHRPAPVHGKIIWGYIRRFGVSRCIHSQPRWCSPVKLSHVIELRKKSLLVHSALLLFYSDIVSWLLLCLCKGDVTNTWLGHTKIKGDNLTLNTTYSRFHVITKWEYVYKIFQPLGAVITM